MAKEEIEGSYAESFKMLRCYASMVLVTNRNSVAIVNSELLPSPITGNLEDRNTPPPHFKRIFICFDGGKTWTSSRLSTVLWFRWLPP